TASSSSRLRAAPVAEHTVAAPPPLAASYAHQDLVTVAHPTGETIVKFREIHLFGQRLALEELEVGSGGGDHIGGRRDGQGDAICDSEICLTPGLLRSEEHTSEL